MINGVIRPWSNFGLYEVPNLMQTEQKLLFLFICVSFGTCKIRHLPSISDRKINIWGSQCALKNQGNWDTYFPLSPNPKANFIERLMNTHNSHAAKKVNIIKTFLSWPMLRLSPTQPFLGSSRNGP